ncbi:antirestriction protein [Pseudomonas syringae]|uniref:antirestriction protein n=1 Tax=Pseudomonas syringae TaxID=317 RepID=UPI0002098DF1|nr:antirestriction protein [Pseudomonas syringae]MDP5168579.1 antirestriction protein [Pseudomonas syringae pv. aptata str. DSM 50252]
MKSEDVATVTVSIVRDQDRLNFLPIFYGNYFLWGEQLVYQHAQRFVQGYSGGFWNFYSLSNGGFFMAPDTTDEQHVVIADNYCSEYMSAEAVGIVLTLFSLSRLLASNIPQSEAERFFELYHRLRDYALAHIESSAIFAAID